MNEIASRYGLALYSIAEERNEILSLQLEGKELKKVLIENPDFITLLSNSFFTHEERFEVVDKTLSAFDKDIVSFIKLIIQNNRVKYLIDALNAFNSLCNNARNVEEGLVYSVDPLDEQTKKQLEKKISKLENVEVELINKIDHTLIGGIKVVINGHIYDGSIKNKLEEMRIDLLKKEGIAYED